MIEKPYNQTECIYGMDVTLCGMAFAVRCDSQQFLDGIRSMFFGSALTSGAGTIPEFICYCATRCRSPWGIAVETPGGLHLARPNPVRKAAFLFEEWSEAGCLPVGESSGPSPDGDEMIVLAAYVRKRLLRTLINHHSSTNLRILHAASLRHRKKGLLILGSSRSGKSTLTLAGLLAGMRYLAEDIAIVDLDRGMILPFPVPIRLRAGALNLSGSFRELSGPKIIDAFGDFRWLIDPADIGRDVERSPACLSHILYLGDLEKNPRIRNLNGITLARACVEADYFAGRHDALDTLWQWAGWIQHCRTACLHPGPLDETVALVKAWMDESPE